MILVHTFPVIFVLIICSHEFSANICDSDIDAAVRRFEKPTNVFLLSGDQIWELDRSTGLVVQQQITPWRGIPNYVNYATGGPVGNLFMYVFAKDELIFIYACINTTQNCAQIRRYTLRTMFVGTKTFRGEACFAYVPGMLQPKQLNSRYPYIAHCFLRNGKEELDCRNSDQNGNVTERLHCDLNKLKAGLFPNFDILNPYEEKVLAVEAIHDATRKQTDFLVVGPELVRYTYRGTPKVISKSELFKCNYMATAMLIFIGISTLVTLVNCSAAFLIFTFVQKKTTDVTENERHLEIEEQSYG